MGMGWRRGGGDGAVAARWVLLLCAGSFFLGLLFTNGYVVSSLLHCSLAVDQRLQISLPPTGVLRALDLGRRVLAWGQARSGLLLLAFSGADLGQWAVLGSSTRVKNSDFCG